MRLLAETELVRRLETAEPWTSDLFSGGREGEIACKLYIHLHTCTTLAHITPAHITPAHITPAHISTHIIPCTCRVQLIFFPLKCVIDVPHSGPCCRALYRKAQDSVHTYTFTITDTHTHTIFSTGWVCVTLDLRAKLTVCASLCV